MSDLQELESQTLSQELIERRVIRFKPFTTSAGLSANTKIELESLWLNKEEGSQDDLLARKIIGTLAVKSSIFKPTYFVGIPDGANVLAERVSKVYGTTKNIRLTKDSQQKGAKSFTIPENLELLPEDRIVLIDDVLTTGHNLEAASKIPEISQNVVGAIVVWDRREMDSNLDLGFDVLSAIKKYVPLSVSD